MNILTISTLYDKGGAAYIAKTLHSGFMEAGHNAKYLVGYGKHGFKKEINDPTIIYANYYLSIFPHLNFLTHKVVGKDFFSPISSQIIDLIKWADVIICHTLHSYFTNFETLFSIFNRYTSDKKIIMVAHDSWHYTGRCAFIFDCNLWEKGCENCPHHEYYPPSILSIAQKEITIKTNQIKSIPNLYFVSPANWICEDLKKIYPEKPICLIRNGIETEPYHNFNQSIRNKQEIHLCVSSLSLSQEGKVNLKLVEESLDKGIKIHFIGKDNPFKNHKNAINHGYITDRKKYLDILFNSNGYLFTSTIDIYPTVLIDALCAGNFIFYTPSKGSDELMNNENDWPGLCIHSSEELYNAISNSSFIEFNSNPEKIAEVRQKALVFFDKKRMVSDYIDFITNK